MNTAAKVVVALLIAFIVGVISWVMYLVTTFLFNFSSGLSRMEPVVHYGALVVVAVSLLIPAIIWKMRSPTAAGIYAAIGTPVAWVVAVVVEWLLSFEFGVS